MGETVRQPGDPAAAPPGRNRRGEKTRHELIEAAWRVVDRMSLVELLSGLTPSVVAAEAGVTTGAVRHHFPDLPALVEAMVHQQVADHQTTYVRGAAEVRADAPTYDAAYWHPEGNPPGKPVDRPRSEYGFPVVPGLLAAACVGFILADVIVVLVVGAGWVRKLYARYDIWIARASGLIFIGFGLHAIYEATPGILGRRQ